MVAILYIVPIHPGDWVQLDAKVPLRLDFPVPCAFITVDGPTLLISPKSQQNRNLAAAQVIHAGIATLLGVRCDSLSFLPADAASLCPSPGLPHQHPPLDEDVRLRLHLPAVGISKQNLCVWQDFRLDCASAGLSGLHIGVPIGIKAAVSVHRGIPAELPNAGAHFVELKNTGKLLVQEVRQHFGALSGNLAAGWKGLCVEF